MPFQTLQHHRILDLMIPTVCYMKLTQHRKFVLSDNSSRKRCFNRKLMASDRRKGTILFFLRYVLLLHNDGSSYMR